MPVVKTDTFLFEGKDGPRQFKRQVQCDTKGRFSINLPTEVAEVLGVGVACGRTMDDAFREWKDLLIKYKATQTASRKVILYTAAFTCYIWQGDRVVENRNDVHFTRGGTAINVAALVCMEHVRTLPDGSKNYSYSPIEGHALPTGIMNRFPMPRLAEPKPFPTLMEWTAEREEFFARIGRGMDALCLKLASITDDPNKLAEIANSSAVGLLGAP
jgi:hypothetical protein